MSASDARHPHRFTCRKSLRSFEDPSFLMILKTSSWGKVRKAKPASSSSSPPLRGEDYEDRPAAATSNTQPMANQQGLGGAAPVRVTRRAGRRPLRLAKTSRPVHHLTIDQRISRGIFGGFPPNNSPPLPRADFLGS